MLFVSNSALISRENCENYEGSSVHMTVESERCGVQYIYIYTYREEGELEGQLNERH